MGRVATRKTEQCYYCLRIRTDCTKQVIQQYVITCYIDKEIMVCQRCREEGFLSTCLRKTLMFFIAAFRCAIILIVTPGIPIALSIVLENKNIIQTHHCGLIGLFFSAIGILFCAKMLSRLHEDFPL